MTDKDLIKKLKGLNEIKPSKNWLNSARNNLLAEINLKEETNEGLMLNSGFLNWLKQPQAVALTICLSIIFFGGPWMTLKASQSSLPGDLLYSVKKISEGVQTTIASDSSEVSLQAEFANRRLEELNKITYNSFSSEEKTKKTDQVMDDFNNNLAKMSQNVSTISKEEAVVIAQKTKKIEESLKRTEDGISAEVKEIAKKAIDDVKYQILAVLTENRDENGENNASTTDKEILIFLEDKTVSTTEEIIEE